jgi:hypothetical protein
VPNHFFMNHSMCVCNLCCDGKSHQGTVRYFRASPAGRRRVSNRRPSQAYSHKATYAVKKAVDLNEETGAALDVLEDEVSALLKLFRCGPHIVRIIDVFEEKTHIYIIMGEMMEHTKSGIAAVFGIDAADSEVNMIGFATIGTCDLGPTKTLNSEMTLTLLTAVKLSWCPVGTLDRRLGQPECCCSI